MRKSFGGSLSSAGPALKQMKVTLTSRFVSGEAHKIDPWPGPAYLDHFCHNINNFDIFLISSCRFHDKHQSEQI